jgi:hypothetical protein
MVIFFIGIYFGSCHEVEFAVKSMLGGLVFLEFLHPRSLFDPALENAPHAFHCRLAQLVRLSSVIVNPPIN